MAKSVDITGMSIAMGCESFTLAGSVGRVTFSGSAGFDVCDNALREKYIANRLRHTKGLFSRLIINPHVFYFVIQSPPFYHQLMSPTDSEVGKMETIADLTNCVLHGYARALRGQLTSNEPELELRKMLSF